MRGQLYPQMRVSAVTANTDCKRYSKNAKYLNSIHTRGHSMVHITDVLIERKLSDHQFCGTLRFIEESNESIDLIWSVSATQAKINVNFVQGSVPDWDERIAHYLDYLSDNLILEIARNQGLEALETPSYPAFAFLAVA